MGSGPQRLAVPLFAAVTLVLSGCGSGSSAPALATPPPAKTFELGGFQAPATIEPGKPTTVSFTIQEPSGRPLTNYAKGAGPHTGVHLLFVRDDLSAIVHHHPPIAAGGQIVDHVTFPRPGRYRMVVDAYPKVAGVSTPRNFQLFKWVTVAGKPTEDPLPPYAATDDVDGYRVTMQGQPKLRAVSAAFLTIDVSRHGKPVTFTPWYGALAHAIFFRKGTLDYFHTHVCSPGATGCTSTLGGAQVTGTSATPGRLHVGVLVPVPGTWRLFLQCKLHGHVVTAPFTLTVT